MVAVISFHTLHDANVTVCKDGEILAVLELERLFEIRYFCSAPSKTKFTEHWKRAIQCITDFTGIVEFDIGITSWVMPSQIKILQSLVNAKRWKTVDHHIAHSSIGLYDSPFNRALILSYDGGGNDGSFVIVHGHKGSPEPLRIIEKRKLNIGTAYRQLASTMPEVTGQSYDPEAVTTYMRHAPLNLSGKVMGYAALGKICDHWIPSLRKYYQEFFTPLTSMYTLGNELQLALEGNALDIDEARNLAATSQQVLELIVSEEIARCLEKKEFEDIEGIIITGGCALNVHVNQLITEKFGLAVHVAPAPNDCGISAGAAWVIQPPCTRQSIQYIGLPCFDSSELAYFVSQRKAERISICEIADLLLGGAIIGVVRGRQEFGPRALGHRSMLCYPNKAELKDKLNKMKGREWFRPLCPSVAVESMSHLFVSQLNGNSQNHNNETIHGEMCIPDEKGWLPSSPYMSFAPHLTADAKEKFPAICHYDGTARVQTVRETDDSWYHSLLTAIGNKNGGYGILLNTSFNIKGRPILNRYSHALDILDTSPPEVSFDYVILEDWIFKPQRRANEEQKHT